MLEVEVIGVDSRLNMRSGEESRVIYKFWVEKLGCLKER